MERDAKRNVIWWQISCLLLFFLCLYLFMRQENNVEYVPVFKAHVLETHLAEDNTSVVLYLSIGMAIETSKEDAFLLDKGDECFVALTESGFSFVGKVKKTFKKKEDQKLDVISL